MLWPQLSHFLDIFGSTDSLDITDNIHNNFDNLSNCFKEKSTNFFKILETFLLCLCSRRSPSFWRQSYQIFCQNRQLCTKMCENFHKRCAIRITETTNLAIYKITNQLDFMTIDERESIIRQVFLTNDNFLETFGDFV